MSDQPEPAVPPLDPLDPRDEETVRRLLAEARHTEPLPADVAARLDGVLADLVAESPGEPLPAAGPVVDLAARRRRRNAGRLLAAAAAVIVAGVGVGQVIGNDSLSSSDDSATSSVTNTAPDRESSAGGAAAPEAVSPDTLAQLPLDLTSAGLAPQLEAGLARLAETDDGASPPQGLLTETPDYSCPAAPAGLDLVPAYLDGRSVVVSLAPASDGEQQATVIDCTTGDEVTSVRVDAP